MHQVLLKEPLLVGNLLSVSRLIFVLLHLLVGHIQNRLKLVLERKSNEINSDIPITSRSKQKLCFFFFFLKKISLTLSSLSPLSLNSSSCSILSCSHNRLSVTCSRKQSIIDQEIELNNVNKCCFVHSNHWFVLYTHIYITFRHLHWLCRPSLQRFCPTHLLDNSQKSLLVLMLHRQKYNYSTQAKQGQHYTMDTIENHSEKL